MKCILGMINEKKNNKGRKKNHPLRKFLFSAMIPAKAVTSSHPVKVIPVQILSFVWLKVHQIAGFFISLCLHFFALCEAEMCWDCIIKIDGLRALFWRAAILDVCQYCNEMVSSFCFVFFQHFSLFLCINQNILIPKIEFSYLLFKISFF